MSCNPSYKGKRYKNISEIKVTAKEVADNYRNDKFTNRSADTVKAIEDALIQKHEGGFGMPGNIMDMVQKFADDVQAGGKYNEEEIGRISKNFISKKGDEIYDKNHELHSWLVGNVERYNQQKSDERKQKSEQRRQERQQQNEAAAAEPSAEPTIIDRTPREEKPVDPARQNLARMYDVLQLAKQYADQDKTSPEEFMRDRDLLNLFNAESVDDLTNAQKHELYKIFMGSTQQLESKMKAIEQALRSTGEVKSALRGELVKARDERKQVKERPRVRVRINSDTGELEHVSTSSDTEEERVKRGNYIQQVLQWRPATEGMTTQQVRKKYNDMNLPVEGIDFSRPSAKLAISMQEMRLMINDGIEQFGKDFADVVREILANPSLTFETRNALVTRLLEMKPFSIDTMQKLVRMDAKLAAEWSNAGLMRRYERELNEEMADELFSAFGETGRQIKEAGQLVDAAVNADISEREQELYEQGMSEEQVDKETGEILSYKPEQNEKTTGETLGDLKNRTRANIALMKQRHSINEDRADQAVKSLVDAVKNKLKKIKC